MAEYVDLGDKKLLVLDSDEEQALYDLTWYVGGSPESSRRGLIHNIAKAMGFSNRPESDRRDIFRGICLDTQPVYFREPEENFPNPCFTDEVDDNF